VSVALLVINRIKFYSLTSCPWDLAQFGGVATYVSHWSWGVGDGGPGRCFPGGHASAGYAFFALAMPGLFSDSPAARQTGKRLFVAVFLFGLICGASQVLRGAHYPSHGLWTGLICWVVAAVNHWLFGYAGKATALPDHPAAAQ
jgi:membrane-associated PAP2 superfamily phosphatase